VPLAELLQSDCEFLNSLLSGADDNSEEAFGEEALGGEAEADLFCKELLAEVDVVFDISKFIHLNFNHHIHGGLRFYRFNTFDALESLICEISCLFEFLFHIDEVLISHLLKNSG
jgi:hypothetical protein